MNPEAPERTLVEADARQEFFENDPTDTEVEDVGGAGPERKPWDPAKIRIVTKPFSLRQVIDMIDDGDIDLAPDFQRLYVWKGSQKSLLIESVLLGIPLPAFYFHQDIEGTLHVVDGVQRLTTIHRFVKGEDALGGLEYLKDLVGKTFDGLDTALRRRFQQTQIFVNVIEPQTPDDVKFDVFRRINTGGSPLTAQEIRHCMSKHRSRDLLKRLTALPSFAAATDGAFQNERRMADREVALRFCAFRWSFDDYRDSPSLDEFLLDFTRRIDGVHTGRPALSDGDLEKLVADFDRAMRSATVVFGNTAFRKYPTSATKRGPLNRALFESWAVALADHEPDSLAARASEIAAAARQLMDDRDYNGAISFGTGDPVRVALRFAKARELLGEGRA